MTVTVSGLSGTGLRLTLNGGNSLAIVANGSATFATTLADGAAYSISVASQPTAPAQVCSIANGAGRISGSNITNVVVNCAGPFSIGVSVSGLVGTGLTLELNGANDLAVSSNGSAVFATTLTAGSSYAVTVATQPTNQSCSVTGGSGTVGNTTVTGITVTCTPPAAGSFTVSVNVTGLSGGTLVLQLNAGKQLAFIANGDAAFSTKLATGASYVVTILSQPQSSPGQTCTLTNSQGTVGTSNVTDVAATCVTPYSVTVQVSGLSGSGLTLLLNGANPLTIANNGTSAFSTQLVTGAAYAVTIGTQPSAPLETCAISGGSGTISASSPPPVAVGCVLPYRASRANAWTDMTPAGVALSYGTQGLGSPFNFPGERQFPSAWTDTAGNFWLFGGVDPNDFESTSFNDLWEYTPSTGIWTWVSGSNGSQGPNFAYGVYGTLGQSSPSNVPGSRSGASSVVDSAGNLWLFGGSGYGATGTYPPGTLNDLWEFSPTTNQWTWRSGSTGPGASGVYGAQGTPSTNNVPGAREFATLWADPAGHIWLFGGETYNDLWEFDPSTGAWTWVSGSVAGTGGAGVYGTRGVGSVANTPGIRYSSNGWVDSTGKLWLFGGYGDDSTGSPYYLNDLWTFDPSTSAWAWISGSKLGNANGIYGVQGVAATANTPGGRYAAAAATDGSGNFWLFGGGGLAATGTSALLDDLWKFSPASGEWTWISGLNTGCAPAGYEDNAGCPADVTGTRGVPAISNQPTALFGAVAWFDATGAFWFFGGQGGQAEGFYFLYDDLWVYTLAAP